MATIRLTKNEADVVRKVAKDSKADCWLRVNEDGTISDKELGGKVVSTKTALKCLITDVVPSDVATLTPEEVITFSKLLIWI